MEHFDQFRKQLDILHFRISKIIMEHFGLLNIFEIIMEHFGKAICSKHLWTILKITKKINGGYGHFWGFRLFKKSLGTF